MSKAEIEKRRAQWRRALITVLKASREDADVSRQELANKLGWTVQLVSNVENGRKELGAVDLFMIASALKLEASEFVRRIERW
jgi:transcriptional regulator with XRE-family HTH domain